MRRSVSCKGKVDVLRSECVGPDLGIVLWLALWLSAALLQVYLARWLSADSGCFVCEKAIKGVSRPRQICTHETSFKQVLNWQVDFTRFKACMFAADVASVRAIHEKRIADLLNQEEARQGSRIV